MTSTWIFGFVLAVISATCWASLDIVRKHVGQYMSASSVIFGVMFFHIPVILPFMFAGAYYPQLRTHGATSEILFGGFPDVTSVFVIWAAASIVLDIVANYLFLRSVQISPLSLTTPYLAFTPIFTAGVAFLMEGQVLSWWGLGGTVTVCIGAFFLNPGNRADGLLAPLKALWTERGSLYMLAVAFLWSINPIFYKRASEETSPMFQTLVLSSGIGLFFFARCARKDFGGLGRLLSELREAPFWLFACGIFSVFALVLQLASYAYVEVAYVETVKRAIGVISAILAGYLLFREEEILRRLLGAALMVAGVAMVLLRG